MSAVMFSYEALDAIVAAKLGEHPRLEPDAAPDALGLVLVVDRSGWEARVSARVTSSETYNARAEERSWP